MIDVCVLKMKVKTYQTGFRTYIMIEFDDNTSLILSPPNALKLSDALREISLGYYSNVEDKCFEFSIDDKVY